MAYTQEEKDTILTDIFSLISRKGLSLRKALSLAKKSIGTETFYKWIDADEEKAKQYARATTERAEIIFEEILDIADDGQNDTYIDDKGKTKTDWDVIGRSRLRVDSRKWMLGKMQPKKYNDKYIHVLEGGDNPVKINAIFNANLIHVPTDDSDK